MSIALIQEIAILESQLQAVGDRNEHVRITNLLNQKREELNKQAHESRVIRATEEFDDILSLDFGGLTLREIIGGESEYQLVTIELKKAFTAQAENFSRQINEIQASYAEQLRAAEDREDQLKRQNEMLQQSLETAKQNEYEVTRNLQDALAKRDAAARELEDAKKEISRLDSLGTRETYKVVDTEEQERQKKELADKIRKERTIYGKTPIDFKRSRFKAHLAISRQEIEFGYMEEGKYFEIDESEVQQFRSQYPAEPMEQAHVVDQAPVPSVLTDTVEQFQLPTVEIPTPPIAGLVEGEFVRQGEHAETGDASIEARVADLERRVKALESAEGQVA